MIEDGAVLCVGGKIVSAGKTRDALRDAWIRKHRKRVIEIDCAGKVVLPGFVDSHTHPAFVSPRLMDFEKRIAGASYAEIAEAGGGIRSSAEAVRQTGKSQLAVKVRMALNEMATSGTTTVEAKSGYGLSLDSELKSLEAIRAASAFEENGDGGPVRSQIRARILRLHKRSKESDADESGLETN